MDDNPGLSPANDKLDVVSEPAPRVSYKSFRRKYRKIMVAFEDKMRESNTLFREHQRILDISRRLSEQNDQFLELLYDLNQSPQVSPFHRYDLLPPSAANETSSPDGRAAPPFLDPDLPPTALREARQALRNGRMSMWNYRRMEDTLRRSKALQPSKSYASLLGKPYLSSDNIKLQNDASETVLDGFPASLEEERYLDGLDSYLGGIAPTSRPSAAAVARGGERSSEKDREMALKNPVSVYNWLRKHQPQVFLQDNEAHPDKPSTRPATSRASKRPSNVKQEPDLYDDDGIAIEAGPSGRGKRKRDDDGGYRPKGGNGRPVKRKKEDGSTSAKKSKRASISGLT